MREFAKNLGMGASDVEAAASLSTDAGSINSAEKLLDHVERVLLRRKLDLILNDLPDGKLRANAVSLKDKLLPKDADAAVLEGVRLALPPLEEKISRQRFPAKTPMHESEFSGST